MTIKVNIHTTLRQYTDGLNVLEVEGGTVGKCLENLVQKVPSLKDALFEKNGSLLRTVEILVNGTSAYPDELSTSVVEGDEIHILVMLAGG
jgi:molybdopterin converting factor small subunit